jgi:hypothetical protein
VHDVCRFPWLEGATVTQLFFATAHGKGLHDGAGGALKTKMREVFATDGLGDTLKASKPIVDWCVQLALAK